jgi:LacI family transcriptional regulator
MSTQRPTGPITIRHVADAVGVAISTVSRALRNDPGISPARRAAVQAAAMRLGYRPNPLVSALMAQVRPHRHAHRPVTVALLNCHPRGQASYTEGYERGILERAEAFGYRVEPLRLEDIAATGRQVDHVLDARGIRGLVVLPVPDGVRLDTFCYDHLAAATIDTSLKQPRLHRASPDYYQGMTLALTHLAANGYRRIGFVTGEHEQVRIGELWLAAYLRWQVQVPASQRVPVHMPRHHSRATVLAWFRRERPDAIVANGAMSLGYLGAGGVRVPQDVGFASLCIERPPGFAYIDQRSEQVGGAAFDLIVSQLNRNEYGLPTSPQTVLVEGAWVDGATAHAVSSA